MRVLGVETSCDETGMAIYDSHQGLCAHVLHSQVQLHAEYGGVVPELASRDHILRLTPLLDSVLAQAKLDLAQIDAIAYTEGPGLLGALLTGAAFAKTLAFALDIPVIGVHHMEGHLLAPMLEEHPPKLPYLALLVSGGHTLIVRVDGLGQYQLLGQSLDDAAGEAFDKTAQLLGLGYPGGPALSQCAQNGNPARYALPRSFLKSEHLDFSFSGLKTAVLHLVQKTEDLDAARADIAASFEEAVVDVLSQKICRALQQQNLKQLVIAGGVGANLRLRARLTADCAKLGAKLAYPRIEFCTDNGAMIAYAGAQRLLAGEHSTNWQISCRARWDMQELAPPLI